jgi:superfamily II DNA or RNA helicase
VNDEPVLSVAVQQGS